ncbi:LacI family transcriptional regulator [Enterococcus sp. JM4C]|nr:ABC transporter substrate-binding protein [Enterococcus sp. JM4C]KAF1296247.1 LacI family transcriptional regulator [Enterococcus sp. JM4C]
MLILVLLTSCTQPQKEEKAAIVVGFSQSGTESNWRKRHTESIKEELGKENYQVLYRNGFMNQERQIQDIRTFIAYKVDIIIFTPLKEDGWEPVLKEAKDAGIPVIITDRNVNITDNSLFLTHIGPSFKAEGNRAGLYAYNYFKDKEKEHINILELKGLSSTSPTTLRHDGFMETIQRDPRMNITLTRDADYIRLKGKEQMNKLIEEGLLEDIDILFSHNDEMTHGALDALDAHKVKKDLVIITIDGQEDMITQLKKGRINAVVECNPNAGWYVRNTISRYFNNQSIPQEIYMPETIFSDQSQLDAIPTRNY